MKIFERRLRVSLHHLLIIAVPFSVFSIYALITGHAFILRGRIGHTHHIMKEEDPEFFWSLVGFYVSVALVGYLFAFFRVRRDSWFNS